MSSSKPTESRFVFVTVWYGGSHAGRHNLKLQSPQMSQSGTAITAAETRSGKRITAGAPQSGTGITAAASQSETGITPGRHCLAVRGPAGLTAHNTPTPCSNQSLVFKTNFSPHPLVLQNMSRPNLYASPHEQQPRQNNKPMPSLSTLQHTPPSSLPDAPRLSRYP